MESPGTWLLPVALLGAMVGSFLNVVAFRLPRGLSIANPRWSFCPLCEHRIRARDNLPIIGWLLLRGRCRDCAKGIARVYPLIECLTALLFVITWDLLFIGSVLPPIGDGALALRTDWPIALAYLSLLAGLLATATMDIEAYMVDIRVCVFMVVTGVLGHAAWRYLCAGGQGEAAAPMTGDLPAGVCLAAVAMGAVWLITSMTVSRFSTAADAEGNGPPSGDDAASPCASDASAENGSADDATAYLAGAEVRGFHPWPILALLAVTAPLLVWQYRWPESNLGLPLAAGAVRAVYAGFIFAFVLVLASLVEREADEQIVKEIEAERAGARGVALREFASFVPAILGGVVVVAVLRGRGMIDADWQMLLGDNARYVHGAATSLAGAVLAAGLGWGVRILGTLAFGKEALGSGDIYILGAIGAVGGLWLAVFTFFLAALLALGGVLATAFKKSSRAIPFGPWLALGAFFAIPLHHRLAGVFHPFGDLFWWAVSGIRPLL